MTMVAMFVNGSGQNEQSVERTSLILFEIEMLNLLAHLAKSKVSFCHHFTSVICRLSSVNFSHLNLLL
jgi:hypothetical protein